MTVVIVVIVCLDQKKSLQSLPISDLFWQYREAIHVTMLKEQPAIPSE